jgi:hypothetical protein
VEQLRRVRISTALGDCGRHSDEQERPEEPRVPLWHAIARWELLSYFQQVIT